MLHYNKKRKLLEKRYRKSMSTDKHRLIPITDLHTAELEIYNERREVQLFHYYEPERGLFIAESPNVILRALAAGYEPLSLLMEQREADSEKGREILGKFPYMWHPMQCCRRFPVLNWREECSVPCAEEHCRRWKTCAEMPDALLFWKML